ncbi:MAG: phosphatase PAP2 family protein [Bacteroidales bacterium]|nr:phosphatase PAP2 family protein [Bacteroidales bacterium]
MKSSLLCLLLFALSVAGYAQNYTPFYSGVCLEKVLPPPPSITDARYFDDWTQYQWGLSVRSTQRGVQAREDAFLNPEYFMKRFSPAPHRELSVEKYPVLADLMARTHATEWTNNASVKRHYRRPRPYQQFADSTLVPEHVNLHDSTSYPSGHTMVSWMEGLVLCVIAPEYTEEIMQVAYELGQSRVIAGYHYQSDVDAGRLCASILFARMCSNPDYLALLEKAKAEYKRNARK